MFPYTGGPSQSGKVLHHPNKFNFVILHNLESYRVKRCRHQLEQFLKDIEEKVLYEKHHCKSLKALVKTMKLYHQHQR